MTTMEEFCKVVIVDDERTAIEDLLRELACYPEMSVKALMLMG